MFATDVSGVGVAVTSVSDWSTQCMGVAGTRAVSAPMLAPSRKNSTLPADHSIVASCHAP